MYKRQSAGQLAVLKNVADKLEQEEIDGYLLNIYRRLVGVNIAKHIRNLERASSCLLLFDSSRHSALPRESSGIVHMQMRPSRAYLM